MNLDELARLAADAKEYVIGCHECHAEYIAACTPERIAALVRVAHRAKGCFSVRGDGTWVFADNDYLWLLHQALRDLEAMP